MAFHKLIATFFGIGYIGKGAGTVAALVVCVLLYCGEKFDVHSTHRLLLLSLITLIAGIISASKVESLWGEDNKRVVIDEVFGMLISLLFLPVTFTTLIAGFILFRFFDIAKPLFIRRAEALPGGWGVMAD